MTIVQKSISLKSLSSYNSTKVIEIEYDSSGFEIMVKSGELDGNTYGGDNLYRSFLSLHDDLKKLGYQALCNGARKDVSLSGGLADVSGGAMLYVDCKEQGYPVVYIFDACEENLS